MLTRHDIIFPTFETVETSWSLFWLKSDRSNAGHFLQFTEHR